MRKTASTFLQQAVFPRLEGVHVVTPATPFTAALRYPPGGKVLISDEGLSGHPWRVPLEPGYSWREDRRRRLQNAASLFPRARVIVCFRRHRDFVTSLYKQYLVRGGTRTLEDFFRLDGNGVFTTADIEYRTVLDIIDEYFGGDAFIFTFDEMQSFDGLLSRLCGFVGVDIPANINSTRRLNVGVRKTQGALLRQLNRISAGPFNDKGMLPLRSRWLVRLGLDPRALCQRRLSFLPGGDIGFDGCTAARIDEHYAADWRHVLSRCTTRAR